MLITINRTKTFCYSAKVVVVRMEGSPDLCKIDEVGELCINSYSTGISYFGLTGKTNYTFKVKVLKNLSQIDKLLKTNEGFSFHS